jgi:hypothetical protein
MKIGSSRVSAASLVVLVIQLVVACSVAGKYLYQRWSCPRVWTRAAAFDPSLPMRGRYLSLQLLVNGCQSTLPSARQAGFPRDVNGAAVQGTYVIQATDYVQFPAELRVSGGKLLAIGMRDGERGASGQMVTAWPGTRCDQMRLDRAVDFFIPEHAADPTGLNPGQELWIEVTVPPKGPPRPIQLALKQNGVWKPLAYQ